MNRLFSFKIIHSIGSILIGSLVFGQFTHQGYSANMAGGTVSGTIFTSEISVGEVSGNPAGENLGFYLGIPTFNMESATISVIAQDNNATVIANEVNGILFRVSSSNRYDTISNVTNANGDFSFNPVFEGNYLVIVDSDPQQYVATYFGDAFEWEEADTVQLTEDIQISINVQEVPPERTSNDGQGTVSGTIEEDLEDGNGRIDARRRAARRKCGLKKRRSGGRNEQDDSEFELIAYGETNEDGEFEYGFLPEGTYRFFVEYPGIPLDETSFVQFDVGEAGVSDDTFELAVFVTEEGIEVELVLGLTSQFFTDFTMYPNPTSETLVISYDKILSSEMKMEVVNMDGQTIYTKRMEKGKEKEITIDVSTYKSGLYFVRFIDESNKDNKPLVYKLIKK